MECFLVNVLASSRNQKFLILVVMWDGKLFCSLQVLKSGEGNLVRLLSNVWMAVFVEVQYQSLELF